MAGDLSDQKLGNLMSFEITYPDHMLAAKGRPSSQEQCDVNNSGREDVDISGGVLRYIDQMLMDDDTDDDTGVLEASLDFKAKERSFYELLGQKYPYSPQDSNYSYSNHHNLTTGSSTDGCGHLIDVVDRSSINTHMDYDGCSNSLISPPKRTSHMHSEGQVIWDFSKGDNDSSKPLPGGSKMLGENGYAENNCKDTGTDNLCAVPTDDFNDLWIYSLGGKEKEFSACISDLTNVKVQGNEKAKGRCVKKQNGKEEVVDLMSILISCAKSYADDNHTAANELLRRIRSHSSSIGDANQRLAHYFADGLEARLAGTRSRIQQSLVYERSSSSDYLIVYCISLMFSSIRKISIYASNNLIAIRSEKEARVHIIDFGISYGFQWPPFIQRLSRRKGGPPKLRITGVDFPQPGFQPQKRIEETGHRLTRYAKAFGVPFEYKAISKNWESIRVKDLEIEEGEFVAVNCLYRGKSLLDETGLAESSRSMVLDLIRRINPDIFVHGTINGAYSMPFFIRRFQEALFHFSALFDMNETILPRESPGRMLIEREIFGNEVMNVIASEGRERVERPETYKQWNQRHLNAGLIQIPFKRILLDAILNKVRNSYHIEFVVFEDMKWLLMSWKGRTISALSCWQAA